MPLPFVTFPRLWHIGSLDPADKRRGSYEGACLSVSLHPAAWREISDGFVTGPCWISERPDARFLDAHLLTPAQRDRILAWGVDRNLIEPAEIWQITVHDEDAGCDRSMFLENETAAIAEMDLDEDDPGYDQEVVQRVRHLHEHRSTCALNAAVLCDRVILGNTDLVDYLLPLWTHDQTNLAGVWWADRYDPLAYSAPRGAIHPDKVYQWSFQPCTFEPYDDEDVAAYDGTSTEAAE